MFNQGDKVKYIGYHTKQCEEYGVCYEDEFEIVKLNSVGWKRSYIVKGCRMVFYESDLKLIKKGDKQ